MDNFLKYFRTFLLIVIWLILTFDRTPPIPTKSPIFKQSFLIWEIARQFSGLIIPLSPSSSWLPSINSTPIISPLPRTSPIIFHSRLMPHSLSRKYVPTSKQFCCKPSSSITCSNYCTAIHIILYNSIEINTHLVRKGFKISYVVEPSNFTMVSVQRL